MMPTSKHILKQYLQIKLLVWPLATYLAIGPLLRIIGILGGALSDIGHPGGEARGITFMASTFAVIPCVYLVASFLFLIALKFRNLPCLLLNGAAFLLSAYSLLTAYLAQ